jgi:hypothetical protein
MVGAWLAPGGLGDHDTAVLVPDENNWTICTRDGALGRSHVIRERCSGGDFRQVVCKRIQRACAFSAVHPLFVQAKRSHFWRLHHSRNQIQ